MNIIDLHVKDDLPLLHKLATSSFYLIEKYIEKNELSYIDGLELIGTTMTSRSMNVNENVMKVILFEEKVVSYVNNIYLYNLNSFIEHYNDGTEINLEQYKQLFKLYNIQKQSRHHDYMYDCDDTNAPEISYTMDSTCISKLTIKEIISIVYATLGLIEAIRVINFLYDDSYIW